jgi:hypothetical protein
MGVKERNRSKTEIFVRLGVSEGHSSLKNAPKFDCSLFYVTLELIFDGKAKSRRFRRGHDNPQARLMDRVCFRNCLKVAKGCEWEVLQCF